MTESPRPGSEPFAGDDRGAQGGRSSIDRFAMWLAFWAAVVKRLAAPMIGGLVTSFIMELLIYPVIFYFYKSFEVRMNMRQQRDVSSPIAE